METTTLPRPAEAQPLPDDLAFADVLAIQKLRTAQHQEIDAARDSALSAHHEPDEHGNIPAEKALEGNRVMNEAEEQVKAKFDEQCKTYLDTHMNRDDNPDAYDKVLNLLQSSSVHNMSIMEWHYGKKDADGNYDPETSGQARVQKTLEELGADPDDELLTGEPVEIAQQREELKVELAKARAALADISLKRRRTHKGGYKDKEYHEEYDAADKRYHEAFQKLTVLNANSWKAQGSTQQEIHAKGMFTLKEEMTLFAQAEKSIVSKQDTRKDRFIHWLAKRGALEGTSAVVGFAAGYGLKSIGAALLGIGAGVTIPALMAVGSAKAVLGARVHQIRTLDKRHAEDKEKLNEVINTEHYSAVTHEDLAKVTSNRLRSVIDGRIETDRRKNRSRVIRAATIGGGAALLGAGAAEWFSSGHTSGNPFSNPESTGAPTADTNPNGGNGGGGSGGEGGSGGDNGGGGAEGQTGGNIANAAQTETLNPNMVDGYDTNVVVENGRGYQREIIELLQEKNQRLSSDDSWNLYLHLQDKFPNGNFFTDNASYKMNDGYFGISHPGGSHWNPAVIHEINRWMAENASKVTTS